jgi:hypothetical protein
MLTRAVTNNILFTALGSWRVYFPCQKEVIMLTLSLPSTTDLLVENGGHINTTQLPQLYFKTRTISTSGDKAAGPLS